VPGGPTPSTPAPPNPIAFIGDSIADTLAPALANEAGQLGVKLTAAVRPGCGVLTGYPVDDKGVRVPWGVNCSDEEPRIQEETIAELSPQLVAVLSSWETADRELNGEIVSLMTPRGEEVWRGLLDEARTRLSAGGAKLALVLLPPPAEFSDAGPPKPGLEKRIARLNSIYRRYARDHPGEVVTVDLARIVCPGGPPCPEEVAGIRLRPRDGGHFEAEGAEWVAPRLFQAIVDAANGSAGARSG
jgi:hypothetical protein